MISMFCVGFAIHFISYATADPTFEFQIGGSNSEYTKCFEKEACSFVQNNSKRGRANFEYDNWSKEAGLGCGYSKYRDIVKTYYLIGTVISLFILLLASDLLGRKKAFYAIFIVLTLGIILAFAIPNYGIRVASLGVAMTIFPSYSALYTIYFTEILRRLSITQLTTINDATW